MKKTAALIALLLSVVLLSRDSQSQEFIIKFATLAPDGSTWMNVMHDYDAAIRKESGGRLGFKMYPGGVQGEDQDVLRKIRIGQLHSAGFTGVGLGDIAPKVRILDSPFLFNSYDEVDLIYSAFNDEFDKAFRENGFVLLGWAEVGFVYVFTNTPVRSLDDMKGVKMWMWEGDRVAAATFKALNLNPIPLSVVDVLTSLQTGLINGVYTSPLAAIVLQWNTRVKYMMNVPLADASGAVVLSKKKFDSLPADLQEILVRNGQKYLRELTTKSRDENARAIQTLKKNGITIVDAESQKTLEGFKAAGRQARQLLVGKLYDQEFLARIENTLKTYRSQHDAGK